MENKNSSRPKLKRKTIFRWIAALLIISMATVEVVQYMQVVAEAGSDYIDVTRQAASDSLSAGNSYLMKGDFKSALKSYVDAVELYGADAPESVLLDTAQLYYANGDINSAIVVLNRITAAFPESSDAYLILAEIYFEKEDYTPAYENSNKCISLAPETARAYVIAAASQSFLGNEEDAIKILNDALPYADDVPEIRTVLAETYFTYGDYESAASIYEIIVEKGPEDEESSYNLSLCYFNAGRYEDALPLLLTLEKGEYDPLSVKLLLSSIYVMDSSTYEKALSEYDDVVTLIDASEESELYSDATTNACEIAYDLGLLDKCIEYADLNLASPLPNDEVRLYRAFSYIGKEKYSEALDDITIVIKKDPSSLAYYCKATAELALEKYSDASADLLKCSELSKGKDEELYAQCQELLSYLGTAA